MKESVVKESKESEKKKKEKEPEPSMLRVLALSKKEWHYILLGCLASIANGGINPAFSIVFSKVITVTIAFISS